MIAINPKKLLKIAAHSRVVASLARRTSSSGGILAAHNLLPNEEEVTPLHASYSRFSAQLEALVDLGYSFLPLAELIDRLRRKRSISGCLALTFDDAYAGVLGYLPELRRREIPATMFVATGFIEAGADFWWDWLSLVERKGKDGDLRQIAAELAESPIPAGEEFWTARTAIMDRLAGRWTDGRRRITEMDARAAALHRPMTWRELEQWLEWNGADCAPHTVTHPVLPRLSVDEQREEWTQSLEALTRRLPRILRVAAYPFGLYDRSSMQALREIGIEAAVTMDGWGAAANSELLAIPRIPFSGQTAPQRIPLLLTSAARWHRRRGLAGGYPPLPTL